MADSVNSTPLPIAPIEGEPRIRDIDLATRLGFDRPRDIRKLIERHGDALDALGPRATVARVINGGKANEYYLNRKQAVFITAKSETAEATDITIEIIERFDAYERGAAKAAPAVAPAVAQEAQSILGFIETAGRNTAPARPALAAPPAFPVTRETTILRFPEVRRRTGYERTWIFRLERQGRFPKRVHLGPKSVGWIEEEVTAWIAGRQAGRDGEGMPWLLTPPVAPPPATKPERVRAQPPEPPAYRPEIPEDRPPLAADLLNGPEKIAAFLGMTASQVQTLASRHQFPAFWVGTQLLARKSTLTRWFADAEAAAFRAMTDVAELERLEDAP
jgi:predicted DNA-binding transcriptional regulator AlpA